MKHLVRFLCLIVIFAASVLFFGSRIGTKSFSRTVETVAPGEAALPTISVLTCGERVSRLYGYTTNLDSTRNRSDLIPLDKTMEFTLELKEYDMIIRRLKYEIFDVAGKETLDSGTINAFDTEGEEKTVRIRLAAELAEGTEYAARITLTNHTGKRIYYYFRVKRYDKPQLSEKLDFLREFQKNTRSTEAQEREAVIPYLEMKADAPSDSFAHVDIHSNYRLVCWGDLAPQTVGEPVITVTEFYREIMTATVRSIVRIDTGYEEELLLVEENFRIRYLGEVVHLLNYERRTQTLFDSDAASLSKSDLKLGVLQGEEQQLYPNEDYSVVAFVRNGSLYSYRLSDNTITTVFASVEEYERMLGQQTGHDILVLKTEKNGDITFLVSGYRNRGSYEGRVGLFVYRYHSAENHLEELLYAPVNTTFQLLRGELGSFAYLNASEVFYFLVNKTLYSYNLITEELSTLAVNVCSGGYFFSAAGGYLAFQEQTETERVRLLFPETGELRSVLPPQGEYIRLLGLSENNLILGYGRGEHILENEDQSLTYALHRVEIRTAEGEVRKQYEKEGYFVEAVQTDANVIRLDRLKQEATGGYRKAESDYILIRDTTENGRILLEKRVTDRMLTEYYISFPQSFEMAALPLKAEAQYLVSGKDPTIRIDELSAEREAYYVYCYGQIRQSGTEVSAAIAAADRLAGTVIAEDGRIVWERGVKAAYAEITGVAIKKKGDGQSNVQAAVALLRSTKNGLTEQTESVEGRPVAELLAEGYPGRVLSMSGVTLDEVLYYVWRGQPVLLLTKDRTAVVLLAYTAREVTFYDPDRGRKVSLDRETAEKRYFGEGSFCFCYLPER